MLNRLFDASRATVHRTAARISSPPASPPSASAAHQGRGSLNLALADSILRQDARARGLARTDVNPDQEPLGGPDASDGEPLFDPEVEVEEPTIGAFKQQGDDEEDEEDQPRDEETGRFKQDDEDEEDDEENGPAAAKDIVIIANEEETEVEIEDEPDYQLPQVPA